MRVTDRYVHRILAAPFQLRHWRALLGILTTFDERRAALRRYLTNRGDYPWRTTLRTPLGPIGVTLADRHDLLTINEIFCRRDYGSRAHRTVVDVGANVGLATLFFLTRAPDTRVWAFEPDPANAERLVENLAGYEDRYTLAQAVVTSGDAPTARFVPLGRYGHLAAPGEEAVELPAVSIGDALRRVAADAGSIDLVKIDTEGTDAELAGAVPADVPVREIRYENGRGRVITLRRRPG